MTTQSVPGALERLAAAEIMIVKQDKRLTECEAFIAALRAAISGTSASGVGAVASDTDLDGKYGDPKVRMNPRDWKGTPRKGEKLSRCEPEFLDMYAETLEFFARKNDESGEKSSNGKPKSFYDRADAARARGWAKRLRNGWQPPTPVTQHADGSRVAGARWGTSGWGANAKHTGTPERSSLVDDPYAPRDGEPPPDEDDGWEIPF